MLLISNIDPLYATGSGKTCESRAARIPTRYRPTFVTETTPNLALVAVSVFDAMALCVERMSASDQGGPRSEATSPHPPR